MGFGAEQRSPGRRCTAGRALARGPAPEAPADRGSRRAQQCAAQAVGKNCRARGSLRSQIPIPPALRAPEHLLFLAAAFLLFQPSLRSRHRAGPAWRDSRIMVYTVFVRFDWDPRKARSNLAKHGVSFELAITAFDDPSGLIAVDDKHSTPDETREWLIGESDSGLLVVVFTKRDEGRTWRLISARRANRREQQRYEETKGLSVSACPARDEPGGGTGAGGDRRIHGRSSSPTGPAPEARSREVPGDLHPPASEGDSLGSPRGAAAEGRLPDDHQRGPS